MTAERIRIDCPPGWGRINGKYVGQSYRLSKKYRAFKTAVRLAAVEQLPPVDTIDGWSKYRVTVDSYWNRAHREKLPGVPMGDADACVKAVLDGLEGVAYEDDAQVSEVLARKFYDKDSPRVEVLLEVLG